MNTTAEYGAIQMEYDGQQLSTNLQSILGFQGQETAWALETFSGDLVRNGAPVSGVCASLARCVESFRPETYTLNLSEQQSALLVGVGDLTFLTSAICEATDHVDGEDLAALGLGVGDIEGEFYPLTASEQNFVGDSALMLFGHPALSGYSVLFGNTKYLAPAIEIDYGPGRLSLNQARQENRRIAHELAAMAEQFGGYFFASDGPDVEFSDGVGKFVLHLFIPVSAAQALASDFQGWLAVLRFAADSGANIQAMIEMGQQKELTCDHA